MNALGPPPESHAQMTGTYVLRDDLHLATPPPHPSEAPIQNPNPLATTLSPPTAGTKLSLVTIAPRPLSRSRLYRTNTGNSKSSLVPTSARDSTEKSQGESGSGSPFKSNGFGDLSALPKASFGEGNHLLAPINNRDSKDASKRRKPKNNIVKSNSSFVSRVIPHESLNKRLQDRSPEGLYAFANVNRALQWLDLSSPQKVRSDLAHFGAALTKSMQEENLTKILFTKAHALCHDINPMTKSLTHIDMVMGFSTGDIIWYEPMSQKYARLNKNVRADAMPRPESY